MKKIIYDEKYHAEALLDILEMKNPCDLCPKTNGHKGEFDAYLKQLHKINKAEHYIIRYNACNICTNFVGTDICPCCQIGQNEAIKRTWVTLEEKGYI